MNCASDIPRWPTELTRNPSHPRRSNRKLSESRAAADCSARLSGTTPHGATVRCELDGEVPLIADVTATAFAELGLAPGSEVWASVKASEITVYAR